MFTGKVISAKKDIVYNQIVIDIAILNEDKEVERKSLGFSYDISKKDLRQELDKVIKLYNDEYKQSLIQKEVDKKDKNADEVINSVENLKI